MQAIFYPVSVLSIKSRLPDKRIPTVLGVFAIVLSACRVLATSDISGLKETAYAIFTAVTQGVLVTGASVYVNQLYIQSKKDI